MPRKPKNTKETDPSANHPSENYREHRLFLIRSLERNDMDMAALLKLNASLHEAKTKLLQSCGELVLLDLGCGRLKLINDELHEETNNPQEEATKEDRAAAEDLQQATVTTQHHLTPAQKKVCVDFLLRMKLRRKLCNRLIRRLNRVASAMDGKDVSPPPPPRYGDLRLHIDPEEVEARAAEWKQIDEAKKRIEAALKGDQSVYDPSNFIPGNKSYSKGREKNDQVKETSTKQETSSKEENKPSDAPHDSSVKSHDDPQPMEVDSSKETKEASEETDASKKKSDENSPPNDQAGDPDETPTPTLESDFELLQEYDDAYEKVWDPETKTFKYTLSMEDKGEPEYLQIKNGAGIGASNREMTLPDREAEHKRWQTNMLARIPDQPTFEELGLKNRVFFLEERRKRCLEEAAEGSDDEEMANSSEPSPKKVRTTRSRDNIKEGTPKKENTASGDEVSKDENNPAGEDSEKEKTASTVDLSQTMPKRSISFAATPSFHEQDLHRLRIIHHDVVKNAAAEQARNQLSLVTNEYNNALHRSTECFNARHQIQHNLTFLIAKGRQELSKAQNEYAAAIAQARRQYMAERQACIVAGSLADVVDGSIAVAEGRSNIPKFKDFVPPQPPGVNPETGEDMAQRQHRVEAEYRAQYNLMNSQFQASETERAKIWRKMMKAKAELDMSHEQVVGGVRQTIRVTSSNYNQIPMPAFQGSANVALPREVARQGFAVASYRPPASAGAGISTSKYSAAKVRQRKSADGTVAPVSEPKKTKEGLYIRPAGRTRKGMRWDAFNGVWVPQSQS
ncbi:hypothetical protein IV203_000545 [Nitzschia inconspicua]|uniref:Uncharacterized protein n=1 Tax=Nitzschia inconspicua TaxID=303405 RepID=A0A9K3PSM8_9STRA|nr:hypothetical protein IV203_000545 [Nitzschia inconspicua]